MGIRPDRATIVYSQLCKVAYKDVPIIIGGVEASLRRLGHYDYWDDKVRRSILMDSQADLLVYGMAEQTIIQIAEALAGGLDIKDIIYLRGTVWKTRDLERAYEPIMLPSFESLSNKETYAESFNIQHENIDAFNAKVLVEPYRDWYVIQNKPALPLTEKEMDQVYALPYERDYHPLYKDIGHIDAINEVKHSIISNRGCFGSCSFCALTHHQGRIIQTRSEQSIIEEANEIVRDPSFKGYIHDVGGPTANFQQPSCGKQDKHGACVKKECLHEDPCKQLKVDHSRYIRILRRLRKLPNVKKVFIRSGIRYDYLMYDKDETFFNELVKHHVSGQLKVAPEHVSPKVLDKMGKPNRTLYDRFVNKYYKLNKRHNKNQYLVPYLMSSHPGSNLKEAIELAEYLRDIGYTPEQVQDFYPTPGTISTCMYYTGLDPRTMNKVYVPRNPREKAMQRALIQYKKPRNYKLVKEALEKANRYDLIGNNKNCLIKDQPYHAFKRSKKSGYVKDSRNKKRRIS
ncbi:hypothetical protein HLPCO_001603 [Haloplasma contractile SSD-17B]|uniref:Radical SAM core domain-containing protein n=1 Tax=Haloplasma contractile SSD-17B TaxID=1033810 RepID=U2DWB8_9MOLU|nr:hypothetical protein HLPCO_001603 [Haloplasma contractile SSD-17B]